MSELTRLIEVLVVSTAVYAILRFLKGTVGGGILVGLAWIIVPVLALWGIAHKLNLQFQVLPAIANWLIMLSVFALLVIFQPELRRGLVRLGRNPLQVFAQSEQQVTEVVVEAAESLAREKMGALIALEREVGLKSYIDSSKAVKVDAEVTAPLLRTLFWPNTALHDGGVVIQNCRVAAAGCFFPLSDNPRVASDFGSRHRAALGLSEETDAIVVVCSEETGTVSVALNGFLTRNLSPEALREFLRREYVRGTHRRRRADDLAQEPLPSQPRA